MYKIFPFILIILLVVSFLLGLNANLRLSKLETPQQGIQITDVENMAKPENIQTYQQYWVNVYNILAQLNVLAQQQTEQKK